MIIAPSLLAANFGRLARETTRANASGADWLHLDIMDGHFVPNLSIGVPIVEAVRRSTELPLDVHLMISDPARYVEAFAKAGANSLTIHIEAVPQPTALLEKIRSLGVMAGLSLNPPTPLTAIESSIPHCDLILVMSVMPGFGGQKFDDEALVKLRQLAERPDCQALLEVDGGVDPDTVGPCAAAGAEMFVAGTAIFKASDHAEAIGELRSRALSSMKTH